MLDAKDIYLVLHLWSHYDTYYTMKTDASVFNFD